MAEALGPRLCSLIYEGSAYLRRGLGDRCTGDSANRAAQLKPVAREEVGSIAARQVLSMSTASISAYLVWSCCGISFLGSALVMAVGVAPIMVWVDGPTYELRR